MKIVHLTFIEKIAKEDYERFVPMIEGMMGNHEKIRILVELRDFSGWTGQALLEETKLSLKHSDAIEKLAVVGESTWLGGLALLAKPFTSVQFFETGELSKARQWVLAP